MDPMQRTGLLTVAGVLKLVAARIEDALDDVDAPALTTIETAPEVLEGQATVLREWLGLSR